MAKLLFRCYPIILAFLLSHCASVPSYEQYNPNAQKVAQAIPTYQQLSRQSWPEIKASSPIKPGKSSPVIPDIRQRLTSLGDLSKRQTSDERSSFQHYDQQLFRAVKNFQRRHGLKADGIIGTSTLSALNIHPKIRLAQLQTSIQQWLQLPPKSEKAYLQVNIPSYQLNIIEDNQTKLHMKVVVGAKKWPTPTLNSHIQSIVINPNWTIPRNIVEKEIVHKVAENSNYLAENNISIYQSWQKNAKPIHPEAIDWHKYTGNKDLPYRLRQTPGDHNALGRIKFTFPNKQHIYLHDTPHKAAFNRKQRNLSHGCIRLENPYALLEYLLASERVKNNQQLGRFIAGEKTKHFALKAPLPIYITNIPSWVDAKGYLHFSMPED